MQKSLAPLQILKILRDYSGSSNPLTYNEIAEYLEKDYGFRLERKAVARHILNLENANYPIERTGKGIYLDSENEFDDSELRLLIDSVLFSRHITTNYANKLIEKLKRLGSIELRKSLGTVCRAEGINRENVNDLFFNISEIDYAISNGDDVQFVYSRYGLDKKLHPVFDKPCIMTPCRMFVANGHYYVLGKLCDTGELESFRIERMTEIKTVGRDKKEGVAPLNLDRYICEHPYLYPGEKAEITLKINTSLADELIDAFGTGFKVLKEEGNTAVISLRAGLSDMLDWAKRFSELVEILSPQSLRVKLRKINFPAAGKYYHSEEDRYVRALEYIEHEKDNGKREKSFAFDGIDLSARDEYKKYTYCNHIALRNNNLSDTSFFAGFKEIIYVDIEHNPVSDMSFLKGHKELETLILKRTDVTDISFLEGAENLVQLEFIGKKIDDITPIYGMFGLRKLVIDAKNAVRFDLLRLKRSCPNLQLKIWELERDNSLDNAARCFEGAGMAFMLSFMSKFYSDKEEPSTDFTREDIDAALAFIKENTVFSSEDMQRALHTGYSKAASLIKWLTDAEYIRGPSASKKYFLI